jgi:hypothetical protein
MDRIGMKPVQRRLLKDLIEPQAEPRAGLAGGLDGGDTGDSNHGGYWNDIPSPLRLRQRTGINLTEDVRLKQIAVHPATDVSGRGSNHEFDSMIRQVAGSNNISSADTGHAIREQILLLHERALMNQEYMRSPHRV